MGWVIIGILITLTITIIVYKYSENPFVALMSYGFLLIAIFVISIIISESDWSNQFYEEKTEIFNICEIDDGTYYKVSILPETTKDKLNIIFLEDSDNKKVLRSIECTSVIFVETSKNAHVELTEYVLKKNWYWLFFKGNENKECIIYLEKTYNQ